MFGYARPYLSGSYSYGFGGVSSDGKTWTTFRLPEQPSVNTSGKRMAYFNGKYMLSARTTHDGELNKWYTSTDGVNWSVEYMFPRPLASGSSGGGANIVLAE